MTITDSYRDALSRHHEGVDWASTAAVYAETGGGQFIVRMLIKQTNLKTILDYGCGTGTLKEYVESQGITDRKWTLYDPGIERISEKPEGTFDLVITTDVLEHVEPSFQEEVITELCNYADMVLYNEIACYMTNVRFKDGPYKGKDLHINLQAPDAWRTEIERIARPLGLERSYSKTTLLEGWKVRYQSGLVRSSALNQLS